MLDWLAAWWAFDEYVDQPRRAPSSTQVTSTSVTSRRVRNAWREWEPSTTATHPLLDAMDRRAQDRGEQW